MNIVCLDLEGVLIPDIWPVVATHLQIEDLKVTTRDIVNYRELMDYRVQVCHRYGVTLKKIQEIIQTITPLEGVFEFIQWVKQNYQLIILSDTFYEFVFSLIKQLSFPTLFCHTIEYNPDTKKLKYKLRQENHKYYAVKALQSLHFNIFASGDSYNDVAMMGVSNKACFFNGATKVLQEFPQYTNALNYTELKNNIQGFFKKNDA